MSELSTDPTQSGPVSPAEVPLPASLAPKPSSKTLRQRTSVPLQAYRFAAVSRRMMSMIRKSHH